MDTANRLDHITILLHWLIAITIIGLIALGLYMTHFELYDYYDMHKSIGIILSGIILVRVVWRIKQGWPVPASNNGKNELFLAKITHWLLITSSVLMPITGMISSGATGHGFGIFRLAMLKENIDPFNPEKTIPLSQFWGEVGEIAHEYMGYILILAIVIHIAGALNHHLIYKDSTLLRMLGIKANVN